MSDTNASFVLKIQDFLASLRLTMALLLILAIVSIIGTVIPRGSWPLNISRQSAASRATVTNFIPCSASSTCTTHGGL